MTWYYLRLRCKKHLGTVSPTELRHLAQIDSWAARVAYQEWVSSEAWRA